RKPPFVPTDDDRNIVGVLSAVGIPQERIRLTVINPATGKPIEIETLQRAFALELAAGRAKTDLIFATTLVSKMKTGDNFALSLYARNRSGWDKPGGVAVSLPDNAEPQDVDRIEIVLIRPPRQRDEDDPPDESAVLGNGHGNGSHRLIRRP